MSAGGVTAESGSRATTSLPGTMQGMGPAAGQNVEGYREGGALTIATHFSSSTNRNFFPTSTSAEIMSAGSKEVSPHIAPHRYVVHILFMRAIRVDANSSLFRNEVYLPLELRCQDAHQCGGDTQKSLE